MKNDFWVTKDGAVRALLDGFQDFPAEEGKMMEILKRIFGSQFYEELDIYIDIFNKKKLTT
ncbi:hypothetical protein [Roseibium sediminis]|uniref:hypothetical protein n=1 Tax=Roseibium sediminis TaxID=1775174 RepID=UPI00123E03D6|nr:hypothetical protein [Roseibium sediminis]